jgi:Rrf2 family protein
MKLSAKAENACLAAITLARQDSDQPLPVRGIAEAFGISERFLVQIMLQLKAAGIVYSTRGPTGGYRLARPADQISLGEVLKAMEGPDVPTPQRADDKPARRVLASVVERVQEAQRAFLDQTSIAHLASQIVETTDWVI